MIIQNIKIQNIRSYEFAELPINKGISAIYGENGSGKTSLLEAIHFGLSLRSFRTSKTEQIIRNNELKAENMNTMIYDDLIKSEEYLSIEDFENLEEPHLIALMYPVKEDLMSKINNIVSKSNSSLYTPWQL